MLNIIEPQDHSTYQSRIDSFSNLLKIYQNFSLSSKSQDKATFIIAEDEKRGVYGGAVFYPQKAKELHKHISDLLCIPENRTVWCVRLCFCIDQSENCSKLEVLDLLENFFLNLHQVLSELGKKKDTNCLVLTLNPQDLHNTITYGKWEYFLEIKPKESSDGQFHGLLRLDKKAKHEAQIQQRHGEVQ